jgi:hypothetical protein
MRLIHQKKEKQQFGNRPKPKPNPKPIKISDEEKILINFN